MSFDDLYKDIRQLEKIGKHEIANDLYILITAFDYLPIKSYHQKVQGFKLKYPEYKFPNCLNK